MGGRGSGGGKGGGKASAGGTLGGSASNAAKQNEIDSRGFSKQIQEKLENMTDKELNRTIINSKNLMNNETAKLAYETNKLRKMNEEFKKMKDGDPNIDSKWNAIEKQMAKVSEQQSYANARAQIHYLAINEKYNVRDKHVVNNLKTMTNGQIDSFYNKTIKTQIKAGARAIKAKNPKTKEKYNNIHTQQRINLWHIAAEKANRNID